MLPNEAGIYTKYTDHLFYEVDGARAEVMLVRCSEGWRWGYGYWSDARVSCSYPNTDRRAWPAKQDALNEALGFLRGLIADEADRLQPPAPEPQMELF